MAIAKRKNVEILNAEQYNPPANIPNCFSSMQSSEGFYYGMCQNGITYLPGDWCVIDANDEHHQYTDEQFKEIFEIVEE